MDQPPAPQPVTPPEPGPPQEPASRGSFGLLGWIAVTLLVLYPLSVGPAARFVRSYPKAEHFLEAVYAPIGFLCEVCPPVQAIFLWYIGVWRIQ